MTVYYAHCIALYNTPQEARDLALLASLGFTVLNPNDTTIEAACSAVRAQVTSWNHGLVGTARRDASQQVMELVFKPLLNSVQAVCFRSLYDGRIPAGVFQELMWAQEKGLPIFELPSGLVSREMTLRETRSYLQEVGQR